MTVFLIRILSMAVGVQFVFPTVLRMVKDIFFFLPSLAHLATDVSIT